MIQMLIKANNISYSYPDGDGRAISGVNLEVRGKEIVAIMGKNGSGKTTLLKLLAGILDLEKGHVKRKKNPRTFWAIFLRILGKVFSQIP